MRPEILAELLAHPDFPQGPCWQRRSFAANEAIVREGQFDQTLYVIEQGTAQVYCEVSLDEERHVRPGIWELKQGDLVGELSLFDDRPRAASVFATSEGRLVAIDGPRLRQFLDSHPEIGYPFLKELFLLLVDRLRKANHRLESVFAWGLRARGIDRHL